MEDAGAEAETNIPTAWSWLGDAAAGAALCSITGLVLAAAEHLVTEMLPMQAARAP